MILIYKCKKGGSSGGVMFKVLNCCLEVSMFEL